MRSRSLSGTPGPRSATVSARPDRAAPDLQLRSAIPARDRRAFSIRLRRSRRNSRASPCKLTGSPLTSAPMPPPLPPRARAGLRPRVAAVHLRVQPACQQQLADQVVQFGDVSASRPRSSGRSSPGSSSSAMRMRASGVRSSCETWASTLFCAPTSRLDALRGTVEAAREVRHLVLAFDLHARLQIPCPERLDARLQSLQPPRDASDQRIAAGGNRHEQQPERQAEHPKGTVPVVRAHQHPSLIGQVQRNDRSATPTPATTAALRAGRQRRQLRAGSRQESAIGSEDCQVYLEHLREFVGLGL